MYINHVQRLCCDIDATVMTIEISHFKGFFFSIRLVSVSVGLLAMALYTTYVYLPGYMMRIYAYFATTAVAGDLSSVS